MGALDDVLKGSATGLDTGGDTGAPGGGSPLDQVLGRSPSVDPTPALRSVLDTNPDENAKNLDLSQSSGFPLPAVEQAGEQIKLQQLELDILKELETAPITRDFMAVRPNAMVAFDEVQRLAEAERVWTLTHKRDTWFEGLAKTVENIPTLFKQMGLGLTQYLIENPMFLPLSEEGLKTVKPGADIVQKMYEATIADLQANAPQAPPESAQQYSYDMLTGLVQMAPVLATAMATRNPNAGLAVMGVEVFGQKYGLSRTEGRTPEQAVMDATFYALAETIPERIPLGILLKQGQPFLPTLLKVMGVEGLQETFTEVLELAYDKGVVGKEMTWGEAWVRMKHAGIVGAGVGAGMAGIVHPFTGSVREQDNQAADTADVMRDRVVEAQKIVVNSALAERAPDKLAEHTAAAMKQSGATEVSIPIQALDDVLGTESVDELLATIGVSDQAPEARLLGGDVQLTPEQFARHIMLSPQFEKLADHVRFGASAMTAAEAKEYRTEQEELAKQLEEVAADGPIPSFEITGADLGEIYHGGATTITEVEAEKPASTEAAPETIAAAAIRHNDKIFTGGDHGAAFMKAQDQFGTELSINENIATIEQGFLTSTGRFITRQEALVLAAKTSQIKEGVSLRDITLSGGGVTAEDLNFIAKPIEIATELMGLQGLFTSAKDAGMTEKQYASYLEAVARAADNTRKRQENAVLQGQLREKDAEWVAEREAMRQDVERDVGRQPIYEALQGIGRDRLDRAAVVELVGEAGLDLLPKQELPGQPARAIYGTKTETGGVLPQTLAELYDFEDGAALMNALLHAPSFEDAVTAELDARMRERHGTLLDQRQAIQAAIQSLHHDTQADLLAYELWWLRGAKKEGRLKPALVRAAAKARLQQTKVGAIRSDRFLQAERRFAKLAGKLLRAGDRAGAAKAKFQQLLNFQMALESFSAEQRVRKQNKYMTKFLRPRKKWKTLPADYLTAIRGELGNYNLANKLSAKKWFNLEAWAQAKAASDGTAYEVPKRIRDQTEKINYQDMTLAEWDELHAVVKGLHHVGVGENKMLLESERQERQVIVDEIKNAAFENLGQRTLDVETRQPREQMKRWGREILTSWLNADTILREIDGFLDLGPAYRNIKGRIDRALSEGYQPGQKGFARRQKQEADTIVQLYAIYSRKERARFDRKLVVPGVHQKLSRNAILSVLLNSGNTENLEALLESNAFTAEEIAAVHQFASKKDWDFAQSVWNYLDGFWPEIVTATKRRRGIVEEKVQAVEVATPHGTYRGGYYPLRYDKDQGVLVNTASVEQMIEDMRFGRPIASHSQRSHTEARIGSGGRAVLLNLSVINSHIQQVIYDLEVGDALTDAYRILYHKDMRQTFREVGHLEKWEALDLWLGDQITGEIQMGAAWERFFRHTRTGLTVAKLGWNAGTALLQPLGIIQTSVVIGKRATWYGLRRVLSSPQVGERSIYQWVSEQTGFMEQRQTTFHKDITDAANQLSGSLAAKYSPQWLNDVGRVSTFFMIAKAQKFADTVTWIGAQYKGMQEFNGDRAKANEYADRMVARSQASGIFADRTAFERGTISNKIRQTELVRIFTIFISYFAAKTNVAYERTRRTDFRNPGQVLHLAADMILLFVAETAIASLIYNRWPDDDDKEGRLKQIGGDILSAFFAGVPVVREIWSAIRGFTGGGTIGSLGKEFHDLAVQVGQGEIDAALLKNLNDVGGIVFKYPSGQIGKTGAATTQWLSGEDVEIQEFIFGPNRNK